MALRRRTKTMFITGASGLLGRHLQRSPAAAHWELIAPGSSSMDIRRRDDVIAMITDWKPAAVVHLAYRRDDRRAIVDGSRHVAEAAAACGARLVHLSTDVVFAGRPAAYTERDVPFPIIDYGRMKADAEIEVMAACPTAALVRTSLMYGTDVLAPVQLDVQRALRGETNTAFFTDEYRCPSHAADIATAVARIAAMPDIIGPIHVAGPEAISRSDLAAHIARWLGMNPNLVRTSTLAASGLDRPARVVLDCTLANERGLTVRPLRTAMA
jgi:dTDP-4-dehydrorhamnose reductase